LVREVDWEDQRFQLVDTGGVVMLDAEGRKNHRIRHPRSSGRGARRCCRGDPGVDVQQGVHPLDEEVARIIRKSGVPCVVAVNKCDQPQHETGAEEFARLVLRFFLWRPAQPRYGRSDGGGAAHLPEAANETAVKPLRVAIVGRPTPENRRISTACCVRSV
jgi:GTP-binding protein